MPPIEALRAWLLLFVDYIAAKQLIAPALNALLGDPKKVFEASYARMWEAIRALVKRAVKSGDIRKDLDAIDLLRALIGVANVATSPGLAAERQKTRRHPNHRLTPCQIGPRLSVPRRRANREFGQPPNRSQLPLAARTPSSRTSRVE